MELLELYELSTSWKFERFNNTFPTNEKLIRKICKDGDFAIFPGTTVVFKISPSVISTICEIQNIIYEQLGYTQQLAYPLEPSTFHITLHDLVSPDHTLFNNDFSFGYINEMEGSLNEANIIAQRIKKDYADIRIKCRFDRVVNLVSSSIAVLIRPYSNTDFVNLMELHHRFDQVTELPYSFLPHITIAYYKPGLIEGKQLNNAFDSVQKIIDSSYYFDINICDIAVQRFATMNNYIDFPYNQDRGK